ncbi:MAG: WbqC family protein [Candidatus Omnitrophica bacterium]|nr:WbqC family protein [Candidatus Omnitrophota bacterium]
MRVCSIHQPQYLPWLGYFDKIARADVFVLLDNVQFKKNEWQNRNRIRNAQGWQWITVPVLHDHGQLINEVRLNVTVDWRQQHVRSIEQNYGKAPFFKEYWPRIRAIYSRDWLTLADLNIALVKLFIEILGIRTRIVTASALNITSVKTQRLIDICRALECDAYLAGAGGADYMDFDLMRSSGITLQSQAYQHPVYPQVWSRAEADFQPFMSILDLVMNCGDKSLGILKDPGIQ